MRERPGLERLEVLGPEPGERRLPHHLSVLVRGQGGRPLSGRAMVRALARRGVACGSGSACSARGAAGASRVLLAMGFGPEEARAGLRLSVGPWLREEDLAPVPVALAEAIAEVEAGLGR